MENEADIPPEILGDPLFQELMKEGLALQNRFVAKPVYRDTGKGYLESEGEDSLKACHPERSEGSRDRA